LLKKSITYTDFDDNEVTETHYFHLSKADLIEMEVSKEGGMQAYIQRVIASEDGKQIIEVFKDLLQKSYGTRTEGGRFLRDSEKTAEFMASEAYSELFMELVTDPGKASEFINGIMPKGLEDTAAKIRESAEKQAVEKAQAAHEAKDDPTGLSESTTPQVLTRQQVADMDSDELKSGLATGRYRLE
jgi:hypothetical protein